MIVDSLILATFDFCLLGLNLIEFKEEAYGKIEDVNKSNDKQLTLEEAFGLESKQAIQTTEENVHGGAQK